MCRSERGDEVRLMNPHIQELGEDVLYHLALGSGSHDLEKMFGDIKFVCMGGTPQRMKTFAGNSSLALHTVDCSFARIYADHSGIRPAHGHLPY